MDVENLLKSLNARRVRYVIIGATAFPVHGFSRITFDIDIFIKATRINASRTLAALADSGYYVTDLSVDELLKKKILFRQYITEADIHPHVAGATFTDVWRRRVENRIGRTHTYFAGLRDLIEMKKAAGRPKDVEDLRVLEKLQEKQKQKEKQRKHSNGQRKRKNNPR